MEQEKLKNNQILEWQTAIALERVAVVDNDFVLFRRFEKLQRYYLQRLQQKLANSLDALVKEEGEAVPDPLTIGRIVDNATPGLKEYNAALLEYSRVCELPNTPEYVKATVKRMQFQASSRFGFFGAQYGLPNQGSDLCSLPGPHKGYIHQWLDTNHNSLWKWLPKDGYEIHDNGIVKYSEKYPRRIEYFIITVLVLLLLGAPISVLFIPDKRQKVLVVFGCLVIAMALSSLLTDRAQKNRLTFMVAYGAFLVALFQPDK